MRSAALRQGRPLATLALLLGTIAAALMPTPDGAFAAGLVAAVLALLVASTAVSALVIRAGLQISTRTRALLERMIPRAAQSDPDARGHARPRAPGVLLPAV
jgi:hypothetical protein